MRTRLLPIEEWPRLAHTDLSALLPYAVPEDTQVVVVEQEDRIVGCLAVLRVVHVEGLWIDPAYRGRVSVMRRLVRAMFASARRWAPQWAMAGAASDQMRGLLTQHLRAVRVPMDTYVVPLSQEPVCHH